MEAPKAPEDVDRRLLLILGAFAAVLLLQAVASYVRLRHLYGPVGFMLLTPYPRPGMENHLLEGVQLAAPCIAALAASVSIRFPLVLCLLAMAVHQVIATARGAVEWPSEEMIHVGIAVTLIAIVARRVRARPRGGQILVLTLSLAALHFIWFMGVWIIIIGQGADPIRWRTWIGIALFEIFWQSLPFIPLVTAWCFLRRSNPPPDSATGSVP